MVPKQVCFYSQWIIKQKKSRNLFCLRKSRLAPRQQCLTPRLSKDDWRWHHGLCRAVIHNGVNGLINYRNTPKTLPKQPKNGLFINPFLPLGGSFSGSLFVPFLLGHLWAPPFFLGLLKLLATFVI